MSNFQNSTATLIDVLQWRAIHQPDRPAYAFLKDGDVEAARLSYAQLDQQVRALAGQLQQLDVAGSRALLLFPPGLEFITAFLGCLAAGVIAVPCTLPRANESLARLQAIAADAQPRLALVPNGALAERFATAPGLDQLAWLACDAVPDAPPRNWPLPRITPDDVAFLQYTSGSTRTPRGVIVTHGNLIANEQTIQVAFEHDEQSTFVGWLPLYHDMGLIGNVLQPLYIGALSVLMSPIAFLQRPLRWLAAISRYRAHTSGAPNFAYDLCAERITSEERATLDLSSWQVAFNGAEAVRHATIQRFSAAFADCGFRRSAFYPCYGLAEATLFVSGGRKKAPPRQLAVEASALEQHRVVTSAPDEATRTLVSSGQAWRDQTILIVDPETNNRCPAHRVGEIWLAGTNTARGYWQQPEENNRVFQAPLADDPGRVFLRTGDLGFVHEGEIFITGRLKDLIIIRGQNHYPQDIEWTVEQSHPALQPNNGAAFTIEAFGEERLVVMHELRRRTHAPDIPAITAAVRQAVARQHGLDAYVVALVKPGAILKTTSGKIRRQDCRAAFLAGTLPVIASSVQPALELPELPSRATLTAQPAQQRRAVLIQALHELVASRTQLASDGIDAETPLNSVGLDSLAALELQHVLERTYGLILPPASLLQAITFAQLADIILTTDQSGDVPAAILTPQAEIPLSPGQLALWIEYAFAPTSTAYTIARAMRLCGKIDLPALKRAADQLVDRHPALRAAFSVREGIPYQQINPRHEQVLVEVDAQRWSSAEQAERIEALASHAFDLEHESPIRMTLLQLSTTEAILVLVVHHIVVDLWSLVIMFRDLAALYAAERMSGTVEMVAPQLHYAAALARQAEELAADQQAHLRDYWRQQLADLPPPLQLPVDHGHPAVRSMRGALYRFSLSPALTARLAACSSHQRATMFAVLMAAYQVLLFRYTHQRDFTVGTLASGRNRADLADLIGYFVNPVVIRTTLADDDTFTSVLARVQQTVLEALAHSDYPFSQLVEQLAPVREGQRPALLQTMLVFQKEQAQAQPGLRALALNSAGTLPFADLDLDIIPLAPQAAQRELTLTMAEIAGVLVGTWEYSTDLFQSHTIERLTAHFGELLEQLIAQPDRSIGTLPLLVGAEYEQIVQHWNATQRSYPLDQPLHELIAEQARRTPAATAVVMSDGLADQHLSYGALDRAACQVAAQLVQRGVRLGDAVGICMERSLELLVGLLGILKAGAAYLPLDPDYPSDRLALILDHAGLRIILTQLHLRDRLPPETPGIVMLDTLLKSVAGSPQKLPTVSPAAPAYILHTSGSTGLPKGVIIPHRGVCNRLLWMQEAYCLQPGDRVLQKTPISFDVSVWELFWPLMVGSCLVLARPGGHQDSAYLVDIIARHEITLLHFVPSMLRAFLEEPGLEHLHSVRQVICSGEALMPDLQSCFFARMEARLDNLYGPTEASIDVTAWACQPGSDGESIPIGRPIANTQTYVVDQRVQPVPINASGELLLGGAGLAWGYMGQPALTAERFIPNPFIHGADTAGSRLYRTGDLARHREDGALIFLGRSDDQVKIRGNRIEPDEIALALRRHPQIGDAAVVPRVDRHGTLDLVAYYTLSETSAAPTIEELQTVLLATLPAYMVPAAFVHMPALPLTPSGKLDRRALPLPNQIRPALHSSFVAPRTAAETTLAAIWQAELAVQPVGIDDSFFALGGDSIRALRVIAQARTHGMPLTIALLTQHQTIRALMQALPATTAPTVSSAPFELLSSADRSRVPADVVDAYPLSMAQRAVYFHSLHSPHYEVYVTSLAVTLAWEPALLQAALEQLVERHAYLRSAFDLTTYSQPLQLVFSSLPPALAIFDLRTLTAEEQAQALDTWISTERRSHFNLTQGPLVRFAIHQRGAACFNISISSFALDGWCVATLLTELIQTYVALQQRRATTRAPLSLQYRDFVALEQAAIAAPDHQRFWRDYLDERPGGRLPRWQSTQPAGSSLQRRIHLQIDQPTTAMLQQRAIALDVPIKSVLLAAHLRVVRLLLGQPEIITGLEVNGRPEAQDGDQIVGVFNNLVPLRASLTTGTWQDLIRTAFAAEQTLLPYRRYPLAQIQRDQGGQSLFETLFVFTHFHLYEQLRALKGFDILQANAPDQTYVPLTAHFNLHGWSGHLELLLDYNPRELCDEQARAIAGYYERAIAAIAAEPQAPYMAAALLSPAEQKQILHDWNASARPFPHDQTVHQLFEAQVARTPQAIAVACESQHLSYQTLNVYANQLAQQLRESGVRPDSVVGLYGPRRPELVIGLLGILKAGAAYLPLDPTYPPERLHQMLSASRAEIVVVTQPQDYARFQDQAQVLLVGSTEPVAGRSCSSPAPVSPEQLAYVIYTSGSTGLPKGIAVSHRGVVNYLSWCAEAYAIKQGMQTPVHSSIAFDLTVTSLLAPLTCGGTVRLIPDEAGVEGLGAALHETDLDLLKITPSHLALLTAQLETTGARPQVGSVVIGGEALRADQVVQWRELSPRSQLINEYGPTETVVGSCVYRLPAEFPAQGDVPIGHPIANTQVYILDYGQPVPVGVVGELHIGGAGLARGYLHRPDLTAERFVPDSSGTTIGGRIYRTGDLATYDRTGLLHFHGRADRQIKLRGYRIELGEIEQVLQTHPAVQAAAVIIRELSGRREQLIGYVVAAVGHQLSDGELRAWLRQRLPAYMTPAVIMPVPAFPLTTNGKIAYQSLPEPARSGSRSRMQSFLDRLDQLSDDEVRALLREAEDSAPPAALPSIQPDDHS